MHPPNYFELFGTISNYFAFGLFLPSNGLERFKCTVKASYRPQRSGKANEKLHAIKKKLGLPSAGPKPFTRTLEKPRRDMLNKRELVKLDVEVARLKARLGQTDGLLGTLLIANPSAAWAHDFQIRNEKDPQSFRNVLLLHFPNIFSD